MGSSDHWGKPKTFSSDCLVTENQNSIANAAICVFSQRNKGPIILQFDVFINAFTLSPLNGVSSQVFLNHIDK